MSQAVKSGFLLLITVFGVIGNIFLLYLFSKKKQLFKHFNALVLTLASFDLMFLMCSLILGTGSIFGTSENVLKWFHPFSQIAMSGVIYSTIGVSLERFLIICKAK